VIASPPFSSESEPPLTYANVGIDFTARQNVVERYSFIDAAHLNYEVTIDDPKVFTRPWKIQMPLYKRIEVAPRVLEYYCYGFSDVYTLPAGR